MENDRITCFCLGRGQTYSGKRDSIEGNKTRPLGECPICRGTGSFHKDSPIGAGLIAFNKAYEEQVKILEERKKQKELERQELRKRALAKLTPEERDALGITYVN